jgi:hypothetical protein
MVLSNVKLKLLGLILNLIFLAQVLEPMIVIRNILFYKYLPCHSNAHVLNLFATDLIDDLGANLIALRNEFVDQPAP